MLCLTGGFTLLLNSSIDVKPQTFTRIASYSLNANQLKQVKQNQVRPDQFARLASWFPKRATASILRKTPWEVM